MLDYKDDETDRKLKAEVNDMTLHQKDIERYSLGRGKHKDLKHLHDIDEGY